VGRLQAVRSPVDRGKQGTKRFVLVDGTGIPIGCVVAGANCRDSSQLKPTLEKLSRFGFDLPDQITVHLDAGCDSGKTRHLLDTLGCGYVISTKGEPLQASARWVQICTEIRIVDAFIALAAAISTARRLIREAWALSVQQSAGPAAGCGGTPGTESTLW
jgi:hypothetical protein